MPDRFSVARLYVATFDRAADAEGLIYWVEASGLSLNEIARSFFEQPETRAAYPETLPNDVFVSTVYRNLFNREGEAEGITYWSEQLENGSVGRSEMILAFINGAQGDDVLILQHKAAASLYYANCGLNDPGQAHEALQGIGPEVNSLQEAKNRIDGMDMVHPDGTGVLASGEMHQVKALLSGYCWESHTVTYSFNETIPEEYYSSGAGLTDNWQPFDVQERHIVRDIFFHLEQKLAIDFVEVESGGDIRFNKVDIDNDTSGFSYYPDSSDGPVAGDVFIANDYDEEEGNAAGTGAWLTIVHEIGHALGLKHPFQGSFQLSEEEDNTLYTVMTYTAREVTQIEFTYKEGYSIAHFPLNAAPDAFQLYDIMALQVLYGANRDHAAKSDRYDLSSLSADGDHVLIWDAGGNDTIDLSGTTGENRIFLKDGELSTVDPVPVEEQIKKAVSYYVGQGYDEGSAEAWVKSVFDDPDVQQLLYAGKDNLAIGQGVLIENLITGSGNDTIYDNSLDNTIESRGGNDDIYLLEGGYDIVMGGTGNDRVHLDEYSNEYLLHDLEEERWILEPTNGQGEFVELWDVEMVIFSDEAVMLA